MKDSPQVLRLFTAVLLSPEVRRLLADYGRRLKAECPDVSWTREENLHLTLRFIGDAPAGDVERIADAARAAAEEVDPFTLEIGELGCFPEGGRVRIVWAAAHEETGAPAALARALDEGLTRLGYPSDGKPFKSHVTLGRVREDRSRGRLRGTITSFKWMDREQPVREIALMASDLTSRGPKYSVMSRHPLGRKA